MKQRLSLLLSLVCFAIGQGIFLKSATAQIASDRTTNTTVEINGNDFTINQGDRAGNNLFHSFSDFSVPTEGSAFFNNAADIVNIFSRVTGSNISNIDGLLGANGSANLFLINPVGIIFGEGARLDIGGSFLGTTADSIIFPEGEFSATNLANPPLISINAPIGLSLRDNPAEIVNRANLVEEERFGEEQIPLIFPNFDTDIPFEDKIVNTLVGLEVNRQQNITFVGGNIILDGGGLTAKGGKIQLGGLAQAGIIAIDANGNLVFPSNILLSNISLINDAAIDVQGNGDGDIIITGQNIEVRDGSTIYAGIRAFEGSPDAIAGDIVINGIDSVIFDGVRGENTQRGGAGSFTNVSNQVGIGLEREELNAENQFVFIANGVGTAGNIEINTKQLNITNEARVNNITSGQGDTGNIIITAQENVDISNGQIRSIVNQLAEGDGGNITINTPIFSLTNTGRLLSLTNGIGNTGAIIINAQENINISNGQVSSAVGQTAEGSGGNIAINSKSFFLINTGQLLSFSNGIGNTGDIIINAQDNVNISNGQISNTVGRTAEGDGGNITINALNISLTNTGQLLSWTNGRGNAGNIVISTQENINIRDGQITNIVRQAAEGDSGNITISTQNFSLMNTGQLFNFTDGKGDAGNVIVNAQDNVNLSGGVLIGSSVNANGDGQAGDIEINAENLNIVDGARIINITSGQGNTGNIIINIAEQTNLINSGSAIFNTIFTSEGNTGNIVNTGSIVINTGHLSLTDGATISQNIFQGTGNLGDIIISASDNISIDGISSDPELIRPESSIFSTVNIDGVGDGGQIIIETKNLSLTNQGRLFTSTNGKGNAGDVIINAENNINIGGGQIRSGVEIFDGIRAEGNGGTITINTNNLELTDGGTITVSSEADGNVGTIIINANSLELRDRSQILAETNFTDPNPVISLSNSMNPNVLLNIIDGNLILRDNSLISAQATEQANGGNVRIVVDFILAFPQNNDIVSSAEQGQGGNINISAEALFGIAERLLNNNTNDINASSDFGLDGSISIFTPDINPIQTNIEIPNNLIESRTLGTNACSGSRETDTSFIIKGKGGIPPRPVEILTSDNILVNEQISVRDLEEIRSAGRQVQNTETKPIKTNSGDIFPARGIIKTVDGEIILTSYPNDNNNFRSSYFAANCGLLNQESG